jgi:hypothetical protein
LGHFSPLPLPPPLPPTLPPPSPPKKTKLNDRNKFAFICISNCNKCEWWGQERGGLLRWLRGDLEKSFYLKETIKLDRYIINNYLKILVTGLVEWLN